MTNLEFKSIFKELVSSGEIKFELEYENNPWSDNMWVRFFTKIDDERIYLSNLKVEK